MSNAQLKGAVAIAHPDKLFIGGDWVAPAVAVGIDVIDSVSEKPFVTVAAASEADVMKAVLAARRAFDAGEWPRLLHRQRAAYIRRIGERLLSRAGDICDIWSREVGILRAIGPLFVNSAAEIHSFYADLADSFEFEQWREGGGTSTGIVYEPVGVVAAIVPWNGPLLSITYKLIPALLAGCTVIVKMSPEAPGVGYLLGEICEELGVPAGVVNIITAEREVSEALVRHPCVDKVTFTGSVAAGRRIASICGDRIARVTLELGGKSPAVLLEDCDVDAAAKVIAQATTVMSGQVCAALSRVIVPRACYDRFVAAVSAEIASITVGDPFAPASQMGPMASNRQRERVESFIARGKAEGARITAGGNRPAGLDRGFFIQPTVFSDVSNSMAIAQEEIFGPVISVIPVKNEAEALAVANDSVFGLNAAVFTADVDKARSVAARLRCGTVSHNALKVDFKAGFGGYKQSGVGREGGVEGLRPFLEMKTLILEGRPKTPLR
jgi:aldehyde dehydrogenase (NAD+)